jgi:sugar phosphate isomerase/epimerase
MKTFNRRQFIQASALGIGSSFVLGQSLISCSPKSKSESTANTSTRSLGFQSWAVKDDLSKDFEGTMKKMVSLGYQSMELCSPPGYAEIGFGHLLKYKPTELKSKINDAGLSCISSHYGFDEIKNNLDERMAFAKELGLTQMVVSMFSLPEKPTLDDWKKAADELNKLGERSAKENIQMCYHNHNMEFEKLEDQLIYDVLLERLDPAVIKMQFQVWVIIAGYKAADYFKKYPGRFISAHLSDWSGNGEEQVPLGKGKVDWKEFFDAAEVGGIKNYFVEMDFQNLGDSASYLKTLVV